MSRASGLTCHWTKRVATALEHTLAKEESPVTTAMSVPAAAARDIARCIGGTAGAKARESKASIGSAVWLNFLNLVCWHLRSCRSARCPMPCAGCSAATARWITKLLTMLAGRVYPADCCGAGPFSAARPANVGEGAQGSRHGTDEGWGSIAVSYTHLTLPTICSV